MTAILAPPESPASLSSVSGDEVAAGVVVTVAVVVCPALVLVVVMVLFIAVLLVVLADVVVETLDNSAIHSFLDMLRGVEESLQCNSKASHVLSMSSGSCCAMHFAAFVTKSPPLLQRHPFICGTVLPLQRESSEALLRHCCVPEG
jgi:hypothetical protein